MNSLQSGLRNIEVNDNIHCLGCGHDNSLIEVIVRGWMHEMEPGETELQFVDRFFDWREDEETIGEIECVCGDILQWRSPRGTMDIELA